MHFVADVKRALRFYMDVVGFEKRWHEGDGAGKVCQVDRAECEIIVCEDATRTDKARLFVELTVDGLSALRREIVERTVPSEKLLGGVPTRSRSLSATAQCANPPQRLAALASTELNFIPTNRQWRSGSRASRRSKGVGAAVWVAGLRRIRPFPETDVASCAIRCRLCNSRSFLLDLRITCN